MNRMTFKWFFLLLIMASNNSFSNCSYKLPLFESRDSLLILKEVNPKYRLHSFNLAYPILFQNNTFNNKYSGRFTFDYSFTSNKFPKYKYFLTALGIQTSYLNDKQLINSKYINYKNYIFSPYINIIKYPKRNSNENRKRYRNPVYIITSLEIGYSVIAYNWEDFNLNKNIFGGFSISPNVSINFEEMNLLKKTLIKPTRKINKLRLWISCNIIFHKSMMPNSNLKNDNYFGYWNFGINYMLSKRPSVIDGKY